MNDVQKIAITATIAVLLGATLSLVEGGAACCCCGFAALAVGSVIGFLFGVPRVVERPPSHLGNSGADLPAYEQRVNTNLEQISDWLTKIIVGFGLIQLQSIPAAFQSLTIFVARQSQGAAPVIGAVILYFGTVGFFAGYLLTRLYLAGAFSRADQNVFNARAEGLKEGGNGGEVSPEIINIIDKSPARAVIDAFQEIDEVLRSATAKRNIQTGRSAKHRIDALREKSLLTRDEVDALSDLRVMRNSAVHEGDRTVTAAAAKKYVQHAAHLRTGLHEKFESEAANERRDA